MQLRTTSVAFAVCSLRCSAISVIAASDAKSQGHVVTPGERKTVIDMCSALCDGESVTIGSKVFAGLQGKPVASTPTTAPKKEETAFWDQMFAASFLQTDAVGSDVEKPFPKLVQCAPMCQGHMLMCIRKSGPTELKAAEEYQSCLTGVSAEKKVDKAAQDQLESLRQKEQALVGSMLCRNMCRDSEKHTGCNQACDVEMDECLDKATDDECTQMLGADYSNYAGPPKIEKVQPTKPGKKAVLKHEKKAAGKEVVSKVAVKTDVAGKDDAVKATVENKVTSKVAAKKAAGKDVSVKAAVENKVTIKIAAKKA